MSALERIWLLDRIARLEGYAAIALERGDHAAVTRYAARIDQLAKELAHA